MWGIEVNHAPEIIVGKIQSRVNAAPDKEHIAHAISDKIAVNHFQVEIVQFFQQAVFLVVFQLRKVIREIILHGILCYG